jgi:hypothetical protein
VFSGRGNHRYAFIAQRGVQIHVADPAEKLLFQKPLLHPHEGRVVIRDGDDHGGLPHQPVPECQRHCSQVDTQTANDHEEQPAGREIVLAAQHPFP